MWVIFEDADSTEISKFLSIVYKNTQIKIGFTGGNGNIPSFVKENCGVDKVIVYHDLVPDNCNTGCSYRNVHKKLRKRKSTLIVPILCIEHIILKSFGVAPSLEQVLFNITYENGINNAEEYYKYFLGQKVELCKSTGKFARNSQKAGLYYREPYLCDINVNCIDNTIFEKAIRIHRYLPILLSCSIFESFIVKDNSSCLRTINNIEKQHNELVKRLALANDWPQQKIAMASVNLTTEINL